MEGTDCVPIPLIWYDIAEVYKDVDTVDDVAKLSCWKVALRGERLFRKGTFAQRQGNRIAGDFSAMWYNSQLDREKAQKDDYRECRDFNHHERTNVHNYLEEKRQEKSPTPKARKGRLRILKKKLG